MLLPQPFLRLLECSALCCPCEQHSGRWCTPPPWQSVRNAGVLGGSSFVGGVFNAGHGVSVGNYILNLTVVGSASAALSAVWLWLRGLYTMVPMVGLVFFGDGLGRVTR